MKKYWSILAIASLTLVVSAADIPTPDQPRQPDDRAQNEAVKGEALKDGNENLSARQRMVTGKIEDMKEADVTAEGAKEESHLLAKVMTRSNHTVVIDLGPKAALKTEFKNGDEIAAFGIAGRLNDRPLIVASKVAAIVPIQGREEIYESIPVSYGREDNADSNKRFAQDAMRQSNEGVMGNQQGNFQGQPVVRSECGCR